MERRPFFLITIDTEGDNLWSCPKRLTTSNSRYLRRFQQLCHAYDLRPTYLTNYEMARCDVFQEFGREVIDENAAEIGMHLHAWDTPPICGLTSDDRRFQPYLIEYPLDTMRNKITVMTELLEDTFRVKMVSHRAGRWAFDERYAGLLIEQGYLVDCSVTPHKSWRTTMGDPRSNGGSDYSRFPDSAYFLDRSDIRIAGDSGLLEVPMTVVPDNRGLPPAARKALHKLPRHVRRIADRLLPVYWLRPDGNNIDRMLEILNKTLIEGRDYVEFMLHSSEFMPGGSPTFPADSDIERLYTHVEALFAAAHRAFRGATLREFYRHFVDRTQADHDRLVAT